jgi:hypothetical protein
MKTRAPSATNRLALANPIPLDPPVINATLPASLMLMWHSCITVIALGHYELYSP